MKPRLKTQSGFSIIEVVISLLIIGVILILYNGALNSVLLTNNAKDQEIALRIANQEIEQLRATGYAALPGSGALTPPLLSSLPSGQANLTVSDFNPKTKQAVVNISWQERGSSRHSAALTTLITKVGGLN